MMTREEAIKYAESKKIMLEALIFREDCAYGNYAMYSTELSFVNTALTALRGPTREQVKRMREEWKCQGDCGVTECSACGWNIEEYVGDYNFCPSCGAPMTDEAVQMVMERIKKMEEIRNELG